MFGYYRPFRINIDNSEKNVFEAYYCRVCYCLWNNGGQVSRALVTFDAALYCIVLKLAGIGERPRHVKCQRFRRNIKKSFVNDEVGNRIARLTLVGFGGKMEDDYTDKEYLRANFIKLFFGSAIKKAYKKEPEFLKNTREVCADINKYQKENADADIPLDAYGKSTLKSFMTFGEIPEKYQRVLYYLARWSFFVDMLSDYNDDFKDGAPNSYKDQKYPTIQEMLNDRWYDLIPMIKKENEDLYNSVLAIKDKSTDWKILYHVIADAINRISVGVLNGEKVGFNYFKELFFNWGRYFHNKKISKKWKKVNHGNN